ncbi:radical SAM protein [Acidicapsa dinghuensis]|uniref:Radical SAM protein n=1 Tax=Acidicapsa dinghuensis TaxID=2218256 RepID=A0ABW1EQK9_9BACT|nr:radical SAM protein [Acidicapsa dinghuensis]
MIERHRNPELPRNQKNYITQVILKVASRCNLNCSYCYVFNMADSTWKDRPPLMPDEVFEAALQRTLEQCQVTRQDTILLAFHGGEPCLLGPERFDAWCRRARAVLSDTVQVNFGMQTNGTLLNARWVQILRKHRVSVGLSMDGPKDIHDSVRQTHSQQGSYDQVERGLKLLQRAEIPYGVGCVIPLGADPLRVHAHFLDLGCKQVTYLMPHYTHDTIDPIRQRYGPTPCADFLIPIFDKWWFEGTMDFQINNLKDVARVIMGGQSHSEAIGNGPPQYVFIEADGEMEGLDNLRACGNGMARIKLNVRNSTFFDLLRTETMHAQAIFEGMPLSAICQNCKESQTCAGGHLAHRYSTARGFDNPSVWCPDLLRLFTHVRARMDVSFEETHHLRETRAANSAPAPPSTLIHYS